MPKIFERKITPAAVAAGAWNTDVTISVGHGDHIIDRISVESNSERFGPVIVSFVYVDGAGVSRESHLGNGWASLRNPLVIRGPLRVTGSGYFQLMSWNTVVGVTHEINVVFGSEFAKWQ